jgi:MFS family permease
MLIIDRVGRRTTLVIGCLVMGIALLVGAPSTYVEIVKCTDYSSQINGALPQAFPNNKNIVSDYTCIVFIFFYTFGYSIGFGPAAWVYGSEVWALSVNHFQ